MTTSRRAAKPTPCRACNGAHTVIVDLVEAYRVRVAVTKTTVEERTRLRPVKLQIPCACVGGIKTIWIGLPEV